MSFRVEAIEKHVEEEVFKQLLSGLLETLGKVLLLLDWIIVVTEAKEVIGLEVIVGVHMELLLSSLVMVTRGLKSEVELFVATLIDFLMLEHFFFMNFLFSDLSALSSILRFLIVSDWFSFLVPTL